MDYKVIPLAADIWAIQDGSVRMYLLDGGVEAFLIDTGFGSGDLGAVVRSLVKGPVKVINTHSHADHISGNRYFDTFYAGEEDREAVLPACGSGIVEPLRDGERISAGKTELTVIGIPGHTPGSIALLDTHRRLLFSSDAIASHFPIFMQFPGQDLRQYLSSLKKIKEKSALYDRIFPCHGDLEIDKGCLDRVISCCEGILAGTVPGKPEQMPDGQEQRTYRYQDIAIYH